METEQEPDSECHVGDQEVRGRSLGQGCKAEFSAEPGKGTSAHFLAVFVARRPRDRERSRTELFVPAGLRPSSGGPVL